MTGFSFFVGFILGAFFALKIFPPNETVINSPDIKVKNSAGANASINMDIEEIKPKKKGFILFRPFKKKQQ